MQSKVQKWGNSLAVRIPKAFAAEAGLEDDTLVEVSLEDGKIIVQSLVAPRYTLDQLLEQITEMNQHQEADTGSAVGNEEW